MRITTKNGYLRHLAVALITGAVLTFASAAVQAQNITPDDIRTLPGYKSYGTLGSFTKQLRETPELFRALQSNRALAEQVLTNTMRQRQIMRQIERDGSISSVLQEFGLDLTLAQKRAAANTTPTEEQTPEQRAERERLANGNANLRALAAIENAQREKEAAEKRAEEMLAELEKQMEEQEQLANEDKVRRELAQSEAMMANIKAAFEGNPEAEAAFFANTELLQQVMDDEMTLEVALAEMDITLETPDTSEQVTAAEDPPATEPKDQLVHVYGNKYHLNGKDIYDLNHIPEPQETALDANGWPKYLNVPSHCGAKEDGIKYFHEGRYGRPHAPNKMDRINQNYFITGRLSMVVALTEEEQVAAPFVTPNYSDSFDMDGILRLTPDLGTFVKHGVPFMAAISECPGDFKGLPQPDNACSNLDKEGKRLNTHIGGLAFDVREEGEDDLRRGCTLRPNTRYFINLKSTNVEEIKSGWITMVNRGRESRGEELLNASKEMASVETRGGRMIGSTGKSGSFNLYRGYMPYVNACLPENAPKPINYRNTEEGSGIPALTTTCGRQFGGCRTGTYSVTCYDPYGLLPPKRISMECRDTGKTISAQALVPAFSENGFIQGGERTFPVTEATVVEGYGEKLFSNYMCDSGADKVSRGRQHTQVCAAHAEGDFRRLVISNPHGGTHTGIINSVEQCVFDKNRGRFDWVTVSVKQNNRARKPGGNGNYRRDGVTAAAVPDVNKCNLLGKTYNVGRRLVVACSPFGNKISKQTLTCTRLSKETGHVPVLINEKGFGINRLFVDPEFDSPKRPLLDSITACAIQHI